MLKTENIKRQTSEKKLVVENGLIKLPPPDELKQGWQSRSADFPDTTDDEVDKYLIDAPKGDFEGKELGKLWTCFQCGVPHYKSQQERTHNKPYELWICLHKESGEVVTAECNCVAG